MIEEVWCDIDTMDGRYQISNLGNARSFCHRGTLDPAKLRTEATPLKWHTVQGGYQSLYLTLPNGNRKNRSVHRAVAIAFIENPNNYPQVNHIDGNKLNNSVSNLEWCTSSQNIIHAYKNGLMPIRKGADRVNARAVHQWTLDGRFVATYGSVIEGAIATGAHRDSITCNIKGKYKQAKGYIWTYALLKDIQRFRLLAEVPALEVEEVEYSHLEAI